MLLDVSHKYCVYNYIYLSTLLNKECIIGIFFFSDILLQTNFIDISVHFKKGEKTKIARYSISNNVCSILFQCFYIDSMNLNSFVIKHEVKIHS